MLAEAGVSQCFCLLLPHLGCGGCCGGGGEEDCYPLKGMEVKATHGRQLELCDCGALTFRIYVLAWTLLEWIILVHQKFASKSHNSASPAQVLQILDGPYLDSHLINLSGCAIQHPLRKKKNFKAHGGGKQIFHSTWQTKTRGEFKQRL